MKIYNTKAFNRHPRFDTSEYHLVGGTKIYLYVEPHEFTEKVGQDLRHLYQERHGYMCLRDTVLWPESMRGKYQEPPCPPYRDTGASYILSHSAPRFRD